MFGKRKTKNIWTPEKSASAGEEEAVSGQTPAGGEAGQAQTEQIPRKHTIVSDEELDQILGSINQKKNADAAEAGDVPAEAEASAEPASVDSAAAVSSGMEAEAGDSGLASYAEASEENFSDEAAPSEKQKIEEPAKTDKKQKKRRHSGKFDWRKPAAAVLVCAMCIAGVFYYGNEVRSGMTDITVGSKSYLEGLTSYRKTDISNVSDSGSELTAARTVVMVGSSVEEDMTVKVLDSQGENVTDVPFEFVVEGEDGSMQYPVDDDMDGEIYIDGISEGTYTVQLIEIEDYSADPIEVQVQGKVERTVIENISEKIVDESEINSSTDDPNYNNRTTQEEESTEEVVISTTDTVEYVESSTAQVEEQYTETKYIGTTGTAYGGLLLLDGTESTVVPETDDSGYLTGNYFDYTGEITFSSTGGGNVTVTADGTAVTTGSSVSAGQTVVVTAAAADGYYLSGWTLSGLSSDSVTTGENTISFTMPSNAVSVTAKFLAEATESVTVDAQLGEIYTESFSDLSTLSQTYQVTATDVTSTRTVTVYYGWQEIDGKTYYFDKNGQKVTGTQIIQGVTYIFGDDGALVDGSSSGGYTLGIDVSTWQGEIDWEKVAAAGIKNVIIRCGFRGYGSGKIVEDSMFMENIAGAKAAGLKVGVYFFSQAINTAEAVEEASACISLIRSSGYSIDLPITIDVEFISSSARANNLTVNELTKVCSAFCDTCRSAGYSAMVYANKYYLESKLDTSAFSNYYIWLAHYTGGTPSSYSGRYEMWQYTSIGVVDGISGNVDLDYCYAW
ncbi:MAG: GH25 family lysozyme [Oscillospiraceae bacterium]|jgi:GH25 family lysozyme M1 (1,4-beta-N-acetylmuramidase)